MNAFRISDHADQRFDAILNGQRVSIRLRWNGFIGRWCFDLAVSSTPVLHGRRVVSGVDLLSAFNFGLGLIFTSGSTAPGYDELVDGAVKLFHATEAEYQAALAG